MAEQYGTHLRLKDDPNWYRILAFIGPDDRHAPNWFIAYTSYAVSNWEEIPGEPHKEKSVPTEYSNFRWIIYDQIEAMKIDPENDIIEIITEEEMG